MTTVTLSDASNTHNLSMNNHENIKVVLQLIKNGAKAPQYDYELKGWRKKLYVVVNVSIILVAAYFIIKLFI